MDWGIVEFLAPAIVASLIIAGIHAYLGLHVVERGVIFVDLALAQVAALGVAVAILWGADPGHDQLPSLMALLFTFVGFLVAVLRRYGPRPIDWLLKDELQGVLLSLHCGEQSYLEMRFLSSLSKDKYQLAEEMRNRLEAVPDAVFLTSVGESSMPRAHAVASADRLAALAKAYEATIKDPKFVEETSRAKFDATYVSGKEIQDFVKRELAPYKYPREGEFIDALPRTGTNKINRIALRTQV